jgi:hypothetical protein
VTGEFQVPFGGMGQDVIEADSKIAWCAYVCAFSFDEIG